MKVPRNGQTILVEGAACLVKLGKAEMVTLTI
jgi:hypothetical protein